MTAFVICVGSSLLSINTDVTHKESSKLSGETEWSSEAAN